MLTEARPARGSPDRLRVRAASHSRIESGEQARAPRALLPTASETPASESRGPTKWGRAVLENDPERRNRSCRLDQRSHPRSPLHTESVTHFHSSPRCFLRETPPKERKRKRARSPRARDGTSEAWGARPTQVPRPPARPQHHKQFTAPPAPCGPPPATGVTWSALARRSSRCPAHQPQGPPDAPRGSWREVQGPTGCRRPWVRSRDVLLGGPEAALGLSAQSRSLL